MKNESISGITAKSMAQFEPMSHEFRTRILNSNGLAKALPENLRRLLNYKEGYSANDIGALLQHARKPEDWLEICFHAEQNTENNHEDLWTSGLEKFNSSALYLENMGYFYFQRGKYHKSLEYLAKSHVLENSFFALSLAIAAAYALTQYHLVLDYFQKLGGKDQLKLDENLLMKVATSALHQGEYALSTRIFRSIQEKNNVKPLPDLRNYLLGKFSDEKAMKQWSMKIGEQLKNAKNTGEITLDDSITYASVLIHENKFQSALDFLESIKKDRFPDHDQY